MEICGVGRTLHTTGSAAHKLYLGYIKPLFPSTVVGRILIWLLTFHFVIFLWIFFWAHSFKKAMDMVRFIGTKFDYVYLQPFCNTRMSFLIMMLAGFAIHAIPVRTFDKMTVRFVKLPFIVKAIAFVILFQLIIQFKEAGVQPFI